MREASPPGGHVSLDSAMEVSDAEPSASSAASALLLPCTPIAIFFPLTPHVMHARRIYHRTSTSSSSAPASSSRSSLRQSRVLARACCTSTTAGVQRCRGSVRRSSVSVAVLRRYYGAENATVDLRSLTEMSTEAAGKCEQRTNPFVVVTL